MKTLTPALLTELGLVSTRPGYLISLGYSLPIRLSTMGDISWNSLAWAGNNMNIRLSGLSQDGKGANTCNLEVGNIDLSYGALVLNEGASDIPVVIYSVYAGATDASDVIQVFSGVLDGANISETKVSFTLVSQNNKTLYSPRVFINKPKFNFLQPANTKIVFGNETFILEKA